MQKKKDWKISREKNLEEDKKEKIESVPACLRRV